MGRDKSHERRAVFLDRDGVINRNVFNPATGEYEAPLTAADFEFLPGALESMCAMRQAGLLLFMVSNQPNYAKGKSSFRALRDIHGKLVEGLKAHRIDFARFYYCFHHPQGIRSGYSRCCSCRKPSPQFLLRARAEFGLDLDRCWMIGDRSTDVECGRRAGTWTILIADSNLGSFEKEKPNAVALDLRAASRIVLENSIQDPGWP